MGSNCVDKTIPRATLGESRVLARVAMGRWVVGSNCVDKTIVRATLGESRVLARVAGRLVFFGIPKQQIDCTTLRKYTSVSDSIII